MKINYNNNIFLEKKKRKIIRNNVLKRNPIQNLSNKEKETIDQISRH